MKASNSPANFNSDWEYKKAQQEERKEERNKRAKRQSARGRNYQPLSSEE